MFKTVCFIIMFSQKNETTLMEIIKKKNISNLSDELSSL